MSTGEGAPASRRTPPGDVPGAATATSPSAPVDPHSGRATRVRWLVLAFGVALAAVTYLDRVCIATLKPDIMRDLDLSMEQMGWVFSAFTLAYAAFEIPTGHWGDRVGTRRVLTRIVLWWSAFTAVTAGAFNYVSLLAARFLFGAGEAGAWPNATRTFARWFPARERGTVQGIFFSGAHFAGGMTPLLVGAMLLVMDWRAVFLCFAALGALWALAWWLWFRDEPSEHPQVNAAEAALIGEGRAPLPAETPRLVDVLPMLGQRNLILLCVMYFTQGYGFYFFITWLPTWLKESRGISGLFTFGLLAGLPLLLSVIADLVGGVATDWASARFGRRWGRASVGIAAFALAAAFMAVGTALGHPVAAAVCVAIAAAASNLPLGACWGTCIDIGGHRAGMVSACMNTAGQIGGMLSPVVLAYIVGSYGWDVPLYLTAALYAVGAACWLGIDAGRPLAAPKRD